MTKLLIQGYHFASVRKQQIQWSRNVDRFLYFPFLCAFQFQWLALLEIKVKVNFPVIWNAALKLFHIKELIINTKVRLHEGRIVEANVWTLNFGIQIPTAIASLWKSKRRCVQLMASELKYTHLRVNHCARIFFLLHALYNTKFIQLILNIRTWRTR